MNKRTLVVLILGFVGNSLLADSSLDLLNAAKKADLGNLKTSIQKNADIHFKDELGKNALMYAAEIGDSKSVELLLENGADVLAKDKSGKTASNLAKEKGFTNIQSQLEKLESENLGSRATGVVTFVNGEVFEGKRKLKLGDTVLENRTIYVGKKSICDLQIKQSLSDITVRIKENSVFTLKYNKVEDKNVFSAVVKYGGALFNIGKVKNGEKLQTLTPTLVAAVRGTVYEISMDDSYNTKLNTYEGSVNARVRAGEIEDDVTVSNDPNVKKLVEKLEANAVLVENGKSIDLPKKKQEDILAKVDAPKSYERAIKKEPVPSDSSSAKLNDADKPELSQIKEAEIKLKQKEAADMIVADSAKLKETSETPEVISLLKKRREEKMIETFKPETLKAPETMKLKNGQKVTGSIYQVGSKYIVFTSEGNKSIYEKSEVEEFIFE